MIIKELQCTIYVERRTSLLQLNLVISVCNDVRKPRLR